MLLLSFTAEERWSEGREGERHGDRDREGKSEIGKERRKRVKEGKRDGERGAQTEKRRGKRGENTMIKEEGEEEERGKEG